jgi:hypothetical protein
MVALFLRQILEKDPHRRFGLAAEVVEKGPFLPLPVIS